MAQPEATKDHNGFFIVQESAFSFFDIMHGARLKDQEN